MDDLDARWQRLFAEINTVASLENPTETQLLAVKSALSAVRLIQPFPWPQWQVGMPTLEEVADLSPEDCIRHITRIVRADRVNEGLFWGWLRSGFIRRVCEVAREKSNGQPLPSIAPPKEKKK